MPRRSERLSEKQMSDNEEDAAIKNSSESLETFSDGDKTIVERPSNAELQEEILRLKDSLS